MKVYGPLEVAQLEWFTNGSKPAAAAYAYRVIFVTDLKQIMVSDGSAWIIIPSSTADTTLSGANTFSGVTTFSGVQIFTGGHRLSVTTEATALGAASSYSNVTPVTEFTGATTSISSFTNTASGMTILIINRTGGTLTLKDEDAGATAAQRIRTGTAADLALANNASAILCYTGDSRWHVISTTSTLGALAVTRANMSAGAIAATSQTAIKTTTYSIATSDDTVFVSGASAAWSATLPTAVGAAGRRYKIIRTDSTLANVVTVATTGGQTINGVATFKLCTQYEMVEFESDNANWVITNRYIPSKWVTYVPTYTGFGTVTTSAMQSRRVGQDLQVRGYFTLGTPTAVLAAMTLGFNGTNANVSSDSGAVIANGYIGEGRANTNGATTFNWSILTPNPAGTSVNFGVQTSGAQAVVAQNGNAILGAGVNFQLDFSLPISGWEA